MEQARAELIKRIFENSEAMKRGMYGHMQAYFRDLPIGRAPLEVLTAVQQLQPVSSKEVAGQLYLTPGAVSQSVDALDQQGYLVRESDATDRRVQYLKLSDKGQALLSDIEKNRREIMKQAMEHLSLEELTVWLKVQTKMLEQFQVTHLKQQARTIQQKKEVL
jgi:DNA-binding MarR family transcriptional regulator